MAVNKSNNISVNTFDTSYNIQKSELSTFLTTDFDRWEWLKATQLQEAHEYYFSNIKETKERLKALDSRPESPQQVNINQYVDSNGELGTFIFQTRSIYGSTVAYYILHLATSKPAELDGPSYNNSERLRKSGSYEYQLAHYLYFQHINAADYIIGNTNTSLNKLVDGFQKLAHESLQNIDHTSNSVHKILIATNEEHNRVNARLTKRHSKRIRRYRQVFKTVQQEAASARDSARDDLKSAYNTYHAQVDLNSSIIYWNKKTLDYNKSKWQWFSAVILSIILTFASPIFYYAAGGVSALAAQKPQSLPTESNSPTTNDSKQIPSTKSQTNNGEKPNTPTPTSSTIEKVALASGIADLTGAALLVALLSVLLRLCLRQYNVCIYLGHDAEERVTMLKTYLALSNEGKLTNDGDVKLVLETLFRTSQTNGIPDSTPATPIELIIKAFTEKNKS